MLKRETAPARKLETILNRLGLEVILEYKVGNYYIDCFCPELGVGFEYDGPWHNFSRKRDAKRDVWIEKEANIKILRIRSGGLNVKNIKNILGVEWLEL